MDTQNTKLGATTFGALAGTGIMVVLMPEFSIPFLIASALIGGGAGAGVGYTVATLDDAISNSPITSGVAVLFALAAIGGGLYLAHKYA